MKESPEPFGDTGLIYLKLGWWPIPVTGKNPPEPGTTGLKGVVTRKLVKRLVPRRRTKNVALRHDDTVALDVDGHDHDGKHGDVTLAKKQAKWGKLPPTWSSTSYDPGSSTRQHFYRIPEGMTLKSDLGPDSDVEVIHHGHRYSVVWPSKHPDTGRTYQWYDPYGKRSKLPPNVDELPDLPAKWLKKLTAPVYESTEVEVFDPANLTPTDNATLTKWLTNTVGGVVAELDELTSAKTARAEDYKGPPWNNTVFIKAVRLAEIAKSSWSTLTLEEAHALVLEHAPRDAGFTDREVEAIWLSAAGKAEGGPMPITLVNHELTTFPAPEERATRLDPDNFFTKPEGLLTEKLADVLAYDLATGLGSSVWHYEAGVWTLAPNEIRKRLTRLLGNRYREGQLATVTSSIIYGRDLPVIDHEPHPRLINTRSGMLDWKTGKLEPHDPAHLSTVQLPFVFDPVAECPKFDAWLAAAVPPDSVALVWEALGYIVMNGNPLQSAIVLHGSGGNGKGTLLRIITKMVGKHNTASIDLHTMTEGKFEVANLLGKLVNIAGDLESSYLGRTAKFKQITGGDSMMAQHKNKDPFEFVPWAVPVFSANEFWQSADNTDGYMRRWLTLPFPNKMPHDPDFHEEALFAEAPGIFNKAIVALRALMARGDFEVIGAAADLKRQFERESDAVKVWLAEDEHVVHHEAGNDLLKVERPVAYRRYSAWAQDAGYKPVNMGNFYKRLEHMGYGAQTSHGKRYLLGIKLDVASPFLPAVGVPVGGDDDD